MQREKSREYQRNLLWSGRKRENEREEILFEELERIYIELEAIELNRQSWAARIRAEKDRDSQRNDG